MVTESVVITSTILYIKIVAVKQLVVVLLMGVVCLTLRLGTHIVHRNPWGNPVWY